VTHRVRTWLDRWGPILPLLLAEATIWAGFGALLPILPIYFVENGVSLPMLGVVVAAWPIARLFGEPLFGWVADRASRTTMMVIGLMLASAFAVAPVFFVGPAAFIIARLGAGMAAAMYDPAARGYLVDANPPDRQGETFGLYGAAQMGGLMLGPAIGGFAAAATGNPTAVFWIAGVFVFAAGLLVWARVPEIPRVARVTEGEVDPSTDGEPLPRPTRLFNRLLIAAIAFGVGSYFAGGTYEVVWSLYLSSLGASLGMIGLTFFTFALPILLLSPLMGKFIDREGGFASTR
jgi:MFS family permease